MSNVVSAAAKVKNALSRLLKKIKATDKIILSCIVTGTVFLLLALIQIIIITAGGIAVHSDNVMLIITDFAVTGIAGFISMKRSEELRVRKKRFKKRGHGQTNAK